MTARRTALTLAGLGATAILGYTAWTAWTPPSPEPSPPVAEKARGKKPARPASRAKAPAEKACLPPPSEVGPEDMVASAGLDPEVVRSVMRSAVQGSLGCFDGSPSVRLMLSVNVACTGRVATVDVEDDGGASPDAQKCVQEALRTASFPAHALPDGDTFRYPLVYTAPE